MMVNYELVGVLFGVIYTATILGYMVVALIEIKCK